MRNQILDDDTSSSIEIELKRQNGALKHLVVRKKFNDLIEQKSFNTQFPSRSSSITLNIQSLSRTRAVHFGGEYSVFEIDSRGNRTLQKKEFVRISRKTIPTARSRSLRLEAGFRSRHDWYEWKVSLGLIGSYSDNIEGLLSIQISR